MINNKINDDKKIIKSIVIYVDIVWEVDMWRQITSLSLSVPWVSFSLVFSF